MQVQFDLKSEESLLCASRNVIVINNSASQPQRASQKHGEGLTKMMYDEPSTFSSCSSRSGAYWLSVKGLNPSLHIE